MWSHLPLSESSHCCPRYCETEKSHSHCALSESLTYRIYGHNRCLQTATVTETLPANCVVNKCNCLHKHIYYMLGNAFCISLLRQPFCKLFWLCRSGLQSSQELPMCPLSQSWKMEPRLKSFCHTHDPNSLASSPWSPPSRKSHGTRSQLLLWAQRN